LHSFTFDFSLSAMANQNNFPYPSGQGPFIPGRNNPFGIGQPLSPIMTQQQQSSMGNGGPATGGGFRQMVMVMMMMLMMPKHRGGFGSKLAI